MKISLSRIELILYFLFVTSMLLDIPGSNIWLWIIIGILWTISVAWQANTIWHQYIISFMYLAWGVDMAMDASGVWRWLWIITLIAWVLTIGRRSVRLWNQHTERQKKKRL